MRSLIAGLFLSSIVAAAPCHATGDVNVGVGTGLGHSVSVGSCEDLGMGRMSNSPLHRCFYSLASPSGQMPEPLKARRPVPFLTDVSAVLSSTTWKFDNIYYPPAQPEVKEVSFWRIWILPMLLVITGLVVVYTGLSAIASYDDDDKEKLI